MDTPTSAHKPAHRVVLGIADPMAASHLRYQLNQHPRFDLVATAANAVQTLYAVEEKKPAVVLMADDSPGMLGREVLVDIASVSPGSYVIITTAGDPAALAGQPAVASAVSDRDMQAVYAALDRLADYLDRPVVNDHDRRNDAERRQHQDWTKVFAERRTDQRRVDA